MGLFSKWFGSKKPAQPDESVQKQSVKSEAKITQPFFSNAPEHWGMFSKEFLKSNKQFVDGWEANQHSDAIQKRRFMVNSLLLMGNINDVFEKQCGRKVHNSYTDGLLEFTEAYGTSCCIEKLLSKGVFKLNGVAIDNYERYGVVLFESPTPMGYVEELRNYFIKDGYKDLIYFAVHDPKAVDGVKKIVFEPFNKACFSFNAQGQSAADRKFEKYAMWWSGETEDDFMSSSVKENMGICMDILDFHESFALGCLSYAFGIQANNNRTRLPLKDMVNIEGPEGVQVLISLSQESGIIFLFPALPKYAKYRDNFIKTWLNFCYDIRSQILEHNLPKDDFGQASVLDWYKALLGEVEENKTATRGVMVYWQEKWYHAN